MSSNKAGQIIDGEGQFTSELESLATAWEFGAMGTGYGMVAVLGCQSSGKSTLLNMMFGCDFDVMDSTKGRSQTTQGLWLAKEASTGGEHPPWLVLDVEGNDSRERGEDHTAFERKTSLFSLALADVLIINAWHADFGRYEAANLGILKTVFTVILQLFAGGDLPKRTLYFVVRDYDDDTPQEALMDLIVQDMTSIWDSIPKPDAFAGDPLTKFFDLQYAFLPHYKHCYDAFKDEVAALTAKFVATNPDDGSLALGSPGARVPAADLPVYAEQIWSTISANKDLNLPSEREMLAMYRCEGMLADAVTAAGPKLDTMASFEADVGPIFTAALDAYDAESKLYHASVVAEFRAKLEAALVTRATPAFEAELEAATTDGMSQAAAVLAARIPSSASALADALASGTSVGYLDAVHDANAAAFDRVNALTTAPLAYLANVPLSSAADAGSAADPLFAAPRMVSAHAAAFDRLVNEVTTAFVSLVVEAQVAKAKTYIEEEAAVHEILRAGGDGMWDTLRNVCDAATASVLNESELLLGEVPQPGGASSVGHALAARVDDLVQASVHEFVRVLPMALRQTFDDHFKYTEDRLPIRWKPGDNIDERYHAARAKALAMLGSFSVMALREPHTPLLSTLARKQLESQLENDLRAAYLDAQQQLEAVSIHTQIPTWVIPIIAILGFNEFWMILSNPLLLIMTIIAAAGFAALYVLGLMGPVKAWLMGDLGTHFDRVVETLSGAGAPAPSAASSSASSSTGKSKTE